MNPGNSKSEMVFRVAVYGPSLGSIIITSIIIITIAIITITITTIITIITNVCLGKHPARP